MELSLSTMTTAEKLVAMEQLWASLQIAPNPIPPPEWHREILEERQKRLDAGETKVFTLEEVRQRFESRDR